MNASAVTLRGAKITARLLDALCSDTDGHNVAPSEGPSTVASGLPPSAKQLHEPAKPPLRLRRDYAGHHACPALSYALFPRVDRHLTDSGGASAELTKDTKCCHNIAVAVEETGRTLKSQILLAEQSLVIQWTASLLPCHKQSFYACVNRLRQTALSHEQVLPNLRPPTRSCAPRTFRRLRYTIVLGCVGCVPL